MTKILHHKSFHYFLIGLVTAGVSSVVFLYSGIIINWLPRFVAFPVFFFLIFMLNGLGVSLYLYFRAKRGIGYYAGTLRHVLWVVFSALALGVAILISFLFEIISEVICPYCNRLDFLNVLSGASTIFIWSILFFLAYRLISERKDILKLKNFLIFFALVVVLVIFLAFFLFYFIQKLYPSPLLMIHALDNVLFLLFIAWQFFLQPPMLALLGYIDSPKKKFLGKDDNGENDEEGDTSLRGSEVKQSDRSNPVV